jgi:hypothetical protein
MAQRNRGREVANPEAMLELVKSNRSRNTLCFST